MIIKVGNSDYWCFYCLPQDCLPVENFEVGIPDGILNKRDTLVTFFGVDEKNANTYQERNGRHIYQLVLYSKSCFRLKLCCPTFGCWLDVRKAENFASDKSGGSGGCRWNENCCKCSSNQTFPEKNIFNKLYTLKELFIDWGNLCN